MPDLLQPQSSRSSPCRRGKDGVPRAREDSQGPKERVWGGPRAASKPVEESYWYPTREETITLQRVAGPGPVRGRTRVRKGSHLSTHHPRPAGHSRPQPHGPLSPGSMPPPPRHPFSRNPSSTTVKEDRDERALDPPPSRPVPSGSKTVLSVEPDPVLRTSKTGNDKQTRPPTRDT